MNLYDSTKFVTSSDMKCWDLVGSCGNHFDIDAIIGKYGPNGPGGASPTLPLYSRFEVIDIPNLAAQLPPSSYEFQKRLEQHLPSTQGVGLTPQISDYLNSNNADQCTNSQDVNNSPCSPEAISDWIGSINTTVGQCQTDITACPTWLKPTLTLTPTLNATSPTSPTPGQCIDNPAIGSTCPSPTISTTCPDGSQPAADGTCPTPPPPANLQSEPSTKTCPDGSQPAADGTCSSSPPPAYLQSEPFFEQYLT
jgi:hypothetical protein